jgi:hypothetical protein
MSPLTMVIPYYSSSKQKAEPDMIQLLRNLRRKVAIGFVGGSDLDKIKWQLEVDGLNGECILIKYIFIHGTLQPSMTLILHLRRTG